MFNHFGVFCGCVSFSLGTRWDHIGFVLGHIKPCWHHIELTLNHFALFWELFRPCTAFARNTVNTGKIYTFWSRSWWFLPPCFGYFCCSLFWYAALRLCLSDLGLLLGHPGLCQRHVGELGAYWLYFWAHWAMLDILSRVGTILGSDWAILGYFGVCVGLCLGLGHFIVAEFSSMQVICKKHRKYQGK